MRQPAQPASFLEEGGALCWMVVLLMMQTVRVIQFRFRTASVRFIR